MKITVIGAARSGIAAAKLAAENGHEVFLTDSKDVGNFKELIVELSELNIGFEFGQHTEEALDCDLVVSSPGVPPNAEIIQWCNEKGLKIISEMEYARSFCEKNPLIAITGTNGKTTTTTLTAFIFNQAGKKAIACGNIGKPLSALVNELEEDTIIVAETSSYQLDRIDKFRPDVAMILNITPDHLEYHGSMDNYVDSKCKIFSNMFGDNLLILNQDDKAVMSSAGKFGGQITTFSIDNGGTGIFGRDGRIYFSNPNSQHEEEYLMLFDEIRLPGVHNAYNAMAAALAARAFEIRNENIRDSLMRFEGVEHRLEPVRILNNIEFVNDSKATNINAAWYALSSYKDNIVWIVGGRGDSNNYAELDDSVRKNVKAIIAIGEEKEAIFNHFASSKRCIQAEDMMSAVALAYENAEEGDVVLFSPACKSFDMFMNYEHRGEVFKECVNKL